MSPLHRWCWPGVTLWRGQWRFVPLGMCSHSLSLSLCPTRTPPTTSTLPAPSSVSRHQVVSRQSAGVQMCPPTTLRLLRLAHLSQGVFITHSVGPGISVGTTHPGCVMDPPAGCLVIRRCGIRGSPSSFIPLPTCFFYIFILSAPPCPSHLSDSVLYLFFPPPPPPPHPTPLQRNISQQGCGSARAQTVTPEDVALPFQMAR